MSKYEVKSGKTQATINSTFDDGIFNLIRKALPEGVQVFERNLRDIEKHARNNWLVRQPTKPVRDELGIIKISQKTGKPRIRKQPKSKRSIDKFRMNARIIPSGEIEVFLENYAPYAFAIKAGLDSKGRQGKEVSKVVGKRIAKELMYSPQNKQKRKVIRQYTNELMKLQNRQK